MNDLKKVDTHFAFGENWSSYIDQIDETHILEAKRGLLRILSEEELHNKTFLDIGCGSGMHSLAALELGVEKVFATDIDDNSVETTKRVLEKYAPNSQYVVNRISVFDLPETFTERFDIVYSWGVLHHTGDMYMAIKEATKMLKQDGLLAMALYRKTPMCLAWKHIKRWYTNASKREQRFARSIYINLLKLRYKLTGKDFEKMKTDYVKSRGMSFEHDVHDWLGGYPYESISPQETEKFMSDLDFKLVRRNIHPSGFGFFGTGCDEYVFKKK